MAPKVAIAKTFPQQEAKQEVDEEAALQAAVASLREYSASNAVAQLVYILLRTMWHVFLPQLLGAPQHVPLAAEVMAAEVVLFLLFRSGGGLGPAAQERPWVLSLYSILSVGILGKCASDCYIYFLAPHMWQQYRPGQPWGISDVLASALGPRLFGLPPEQLAQTIKLVEMSADAFCLLSVFRGIRVGMALVLARRKQRTMAEEKKKLY